MVESNRDESPPPGPEEWRRKLEAKLAAERAVSRDDLDDYLTAVFEAHENARAEERYDLRRALGEFEKTLAAGGHFGRADEVYRVRTELIRRDYRARWRDYRDTSSLVRAWAYGVWRYTSLYGTSAVRLFWFGFNLVFWFGLLYFALDLVALRFQGKRAFAAGALVAPASYLVLGFQGLWPGTTALLGNTLAGQVALAAENAVGVVLILATLSVVARRVWRGMG